MPIFEETLSTAIFSSKKDKQQNVKILLNEYLDEDMESYQREINAQPSTYWMEKGKQKTLSDFHQVAKRVPAYKDFLSKHKVNPDTIRTFADFEKKVPLIDKKNYISQYDIAEMSLDGEITANTMTSFSSGTSGSQCFWPRSSVQDIEGAFMFEQFFTSVFEMKKKSTLFVICFALGNYVAGTYVLSCLNYFNMKGYPVMVVSPGINQEDAMRMITQLSGDFDQTVLCGYPPLLRDLLHTGMGQGFDWKKIALKFLFSSELFSEVWRNRVLSEASTPELLRNSTNLYGTADATLFGLENPINIYLRRYASEHPAFHLDLFGRELTPTFIQYNPMLRYFEQVDGQLVLSSMSGLPLMRYNLRDDGGIYTHEELLEKCQKNDVDPISAIEHERCEETLLHFPHLYVFGRADGAVSLYGLLIYPEYIKTGLEDVVVHDQLSGKFMMSIEQDKGLYPQLLIDVELAETVPKSKQLDQLLLSTIIKNLRIRSAEYNRLFESLGDRSHPVLTTYEYQTNEKFIVQIKQRWIKPHAK